jgi:hypothetical protein
MSDPVPLRYNVWSVIWLALMLAAFGGAIVAASFGWLWAVPPALGLAYAIFAYSQRHLQGMLQRARESNPRGG